MGGSKTIPGKKKLLRLYLRTKLGMAIHICNPSYWEVDVGGTQSEVGLRQKKKKYITLLKK